MSEMTAKERLLNAMRGLEVDRTPWSPFLAYFWEHQPKEIQQMGQFRYMQALGADPLMRGFHTLFQTKMHRCEFRSETKNGERCDFFETPLGTLQEVYTFSPAAESWFLTQHAVKTEADFRILQFIFENMEVLPAPEAFERDAEQVGENGLYLPVIGANVKTAFQSLVERWCGTVNLTYALFDFPEVVEECLSAIRKRDRETVLISLDSSAEGFIFWEDSSTTNISPDFFKTYTKPEIDEWGALIHSDGKLLIHHACGHLKNLLPLMKDTPIDMVESLSPPPTGNIDVRESFEILPENIGIIGGIEPTFFENCTPDQLDNRVNELLSTGAGKRFILANSDSCPPGVTHEKFERVTKCVQSYRHK